MSNSSPITSSLSSILLLCCCLFLSIQCIHSQIPPIKTFTFINSGALVHNAAEYGATYREIRTAGYSFSTFPFTLCFYNSTPGKYILAVRGGSPRDKAPNRWVWEANRRRPVGEKAALTLRRDGNLILADPDGTIAWQTNTAGRGVTGIKLSGYGNLIVYDNSGNSVWQSFDHPVDALLAGMSLKLNSTKLISRKTAADAADGPYSLLLEDRGIIMYLNNSGELIRYADLQGYSGDTVTFTTRNPNTSASELVLKYEGPPPGTSLGGVTRILKTLNHNAKFSFLRLSADGNLNAYTYTSGGGGWTQTYAYFPDYHPRECALPAKCSQFGLCENNTCIGCPSPKGVLPWSPKCSPPQLGRCGSGGRKRVRYYKVEGAEHFLTLLVSANPMKVRECREMCTEDCNCKGFVYQRQESLCLTVTVLATLIRELPGEFVDPGHDVYVKYYK